MNDTAHLPADLADFEAFIAQHRDPDLQRWLRANPGHSKREWKHGETQHLCEVQVDPFAPKAGAPRIRYVRDQATTYLAHTLPLDLRREAARDPALAWNPLARRYRLRVPGGAQAGCASVEADDRTGDRRDSAPAPGNRSLDPVAGAPDLDQRSPDVSEGVGA